MYTEYEVFDRSILRLMELRRRSFFAHEVHTGERGLGKAEGTGSIPVMGSEGHLVVGI